MKTRNTTVAVAIMLMVAIMAQATGLRRGTPAPEMNLTPYKGEAFDLSAFEGQPVVINFWASWCGPCRAELPELAMVAKAHESEVAFVGAVVNSSKRDILPLIRRSKVKYPNAVADSLTTEAWNVTSLPATFVLDADHNVVWSTSSKVNAKTLERVIARFTS